jgi:hypothetical protein
VERAEHEKGLIASRGIKNKAGVCGQQVPEFQRVIFKNFSCSVTKHETEEIDGKIVHFLIKFQTS